MEPHFLGCFVISFASFLAMTASQSREEEVWRVTRQLIYKSTQKWYYKRMSIEHPAQAADDTENDAAEELPSVG